MRTHRATVVAATTVLIAFASWLTFGWGGPDVAIVVGKAGSISASAFAATCAMMTARKKRGRERMAWACLAVGLLGWVASDVAWAFTYGAAPEASPSLIDIGYFLLPVSFCAGALLIPNGGIRFNFRMLLDGLLVATTLFAIAWTTFLRELFALGHVSGTAFGFSVAYPVGDVTMVTLALMLLALSAPGRRLAPALLAAGLTLLGVADSAYVVDAAYGVDISPLVVIGWMTGLYTIGLACLARQRTRVVSRPTMRATSRTIFWVPYVPLPIAIFLGARELFAGASAPILVAGLVLITVALVRQFLLLDENRRLLATVADMALRDPLTDLANRALFNDRLAHALQLRARTRAPICVLVADLDDFKLVNDSLGHPTGDELLRSAGVRIRAVIRPGDTVARLGGDEFAILIEDAPAVAEQLSERVVRAFDEPFVIDGHSIDMRLSIGLATVVGDADLTAEELFKHADLAMYSAKRAHVGSRSYTPDMRRNATEMNLPSQQRRTGRSEGVARIQFLGDLRRAIEERELDLMYQPKVDLRRRSVIGVEALIRWPHPEFGLLEPADFLALARDNGLMGALTDFVLDRAVHDAARWQARGLHVPVSINVSAPSLTDDTLPDQVLSVLARHGVSPTLLTVEITEDVLLASVVRARTVLDRLRESGVRVAIDDFGSGYAAMTYLHELPVDELKLDRQFIEPILRDARAASIVLSVINLANEFGLTCVAEGVEDKSTAELLTTYGCGVAQGHYFSPAVPARAISLGMGLTAHADVPLSATEATRPSWA